MPTVGLNGGIIGRTVGSKVPSGGIRAAIRKACNLQELAYTHAHDPETPTKDKVGFLRAWKDLQVVVMDLKGWGKPKSVPASNDKPKQARSAPIAPVE